MVRKLGDLGAKYANGKKERIMRIFFHALQLEWTVRKFAKISRVPKATLLNWTLEDAYFDQYKKIMQSKSLLLVEQGNDLVRRVLLEAGHKDKIDPRQAAVGLKWYSYRLMREHKGDMYKNKLINESPSDLRDMTDDQIRERYDELQDKHKKGLTLVK